MKNKIKVIFDCDTGMDDAIAIATLTAIKEFEIMGICTVGGNVELEKTYKNTLGVLKYLNKNIKVYKGLAKPLERDLEVAYDFHGESGIGDIILPEVEAKVEELDAINFMHKSIMENPNEIHLVATGPSTNIAKLLLTYPEIKDSIASLTFMGGSIIGGNVTEHAEFNVYCDPEACKVLVDSGIKTTMVGLDATMKAKLYKEDMDFLEEGRSLNTQLTKEFYQGMLNVRGNIGFDYAVFHDSIALISLVKEDLFKFQYLNLDVDLSEDKLGKTYIAENGKKVRVAMDFNKENFIEYMKEIF